MATQNGKAQVRAGNLRFERDGDDLVIRVNLGENLGQSQSGKSLKVASSRELPRARGRGYAPIKVDGVEYMLNLDMYTVIANPESEEAQEISL